MRTPARSKIFIAIPTYNCAKQITRVLDEIDATLLERVEEIAIFDNRSSDNTVKNALVYKKSNRLGKKLHIYRNIENYNLGGTHKVVFSRAENQGYSHVIILHGDNQAKSSEVNILLDYAETHPIYQTVLGSRFNKKSTLIGYSMERILGNKVLNYIYSMVTFRKCEDLGSGLNLFFVADLDIPTCLQFADKMSFNYELLLDLIGRKIDFAYIPITWREEDQISNARNFNVFKTALINLYNWRLGKKYTKIKTLEDYKCKEIIQ